MNIAQNLIYILGFRATVKNQICLVPWLFKHCKYSVNHVTLYFKTYNYLIISLIVATSAQTIIMYH